MNNGTKSGQIDFYYISSNFSDILIKLGDKLTGRNKKTLILFLIQVGKVKYIYHPSQD